ncbi:hypothetical protein PM082_023162 [Marasmius tenuissimus]|nr:hypothetical protein PM082_023162 [Marasmius tenuissimus]
MMAQLESLRNRSKAVVKLDHDVSQEPSSGQPDPKADATNIPAEVTDEEDMPQALDDDMDLSASSPAPIEDQFEDPLPPSTAASPPKRSRKDVAERWQELLPTLVQPLLAFRDRTVGSYSRELDSPGSCTTGSCIILEADIQIITFDYHRVKTFHHCQCQNLSQVLVARGLFPTSPSQPRMAISIALLDFYQTLCQFSSDAVTALVGGLAMVYRRRGFRLRSPTGEALQDPIRRALGHSLQWYDALVVAVERHVTEKVNSLKGMLPKLPDTITSLPSPLSRSNAFNIVSSSRATLNPPSATPPSSTITTSGTTLSATTSSSTSSSTPSVNVSAPSTSQTQPATHSPSTTTTAATVSPPSQPNEPVALQSGACHPYLQRLCPACFGGTEFGRTFQQGGDIHVALDGNFHHRHLKSGGNGKPFHSSVRFLSKDFVKSVSERLADARGRPPKPCEVVVPDDVVDSDRDAYKAAKGDSQKKPNDIFDKNGLMALRAVRLWMLDRQCDAIARDIREDLGSWLRRKIHKNVQKKEGEAVRTLRKLSMSVEEPREHWDAQRAAQSTSPSLVPARLKKVLEKVLQLQAQIDALEEEIAEAKAAIRMMDFPPADATFILQNLEATHCKLKLEAEALYSSLNITDEYPELQNLPLEYLHKLILARDLKLTIRKKAIGSFFEWDKLDMAVGGMHEALGTKAHQVTREAIARRKTAFENLIRKFNQYVTELEEEHRPHYRVPVPKKLPTQLGTLCDMETSHLWEDVWICENTVPPKWLVDEDI